MENCPLAFTSDKLSELLYLCNLTGFYVSELSNKGQDAQPREVSDFKDINTWNGRDIEFEHNNNRANRAQFETTALTG